MTFAVSDEAEVLYAYGYGAYSDAPIRYAYTEQELSVSDAPIVFRYSHDRDRWDRQAGFWAWSTQEIANRFPRWNLMRLNTGGPSQQLVNAWGMGFDDLNHELARFKKDLFIDTAELDQPDLFYYGPTIDYQGRPEKPRNKNLLRNPSFALKGLARRNTPMWWSTERAKTTGSVQLVSAPSFIGTYSARMDADPNERAYLVQTIQVPFEKATHLTLSLWYMVPIPVDVLTAEESRAGIFLSVLYADGSAAMHRASLDLGTDGRWRLASVSIELEQEMYACTIGIQIENDTGSSIRLYAGAAQLEPNAVATSWSEHQLTVVPYVNERVIVSSPVDAYIDMGSEEVTEEIVENEPVTYLSRSGRTLFYVEGYWNLWYDAVPSRATIAVIEEPPVSTQRIMLGWYANPQKERYSTSWRIADNKIEQYNREIPAEVICQFDVGEMHLDEDQREQMGIYNAEDDDEDFIRTFETLCVFRGRLWVVCKEVEAGITTRVIKILDPHSRWPIPLAYEQELESLHLECIGDVEVGVSTDICTYIGVADEDPDKLVLQIGAVYYVVSLDYDFYYLDRNKAQVVMRTDHGGQLVTL